MPKALKEEISAQPGSEGIEQKTEPEESPAMEIAEEHPKFKERIDQFTRRLSETETLLEQERAAREKDNQAFQTLSTQYTDLAETLNGVEDQISINEAPNYDDDPKAYLDWQSNRTLKRIEKMVKSTPQTPPVPTNQPTATQTLPPISAQEAAMAAVHDDYYAVIKEVNQELDKNPALEAAIFGEPNPYKAGYDFGIKKRKLTEQLRQTTLDQSYVEGATPPAQDVNKLTETDKITIARMKAGGADMTEEKFLKTKQNIAKRKGRK